LKELYCLHISKGTDSLTYIFLLEEFHALKSPRWSEMSLTTARGDSGLALHVLLSIHVADAFVTLVDVLIDEYKPNYMKIINSRPLFAFNLIK
jgi:hypothetical protein